MIRTFLTTTALTALLTAGAFAQDAAPATTDPNPATTNATSQPLDMAAGYMSADTDDLASRILGTPVYSGPTNDADHIGDVNDLVVGEDGRVRAVIIGVGGFLGVGEKNVAVDFSQMKMVVAEDNTERWVLETTKEALEAAPAFAFVEDDAGAETAAAENAANAPAENAAVPAADSTVTADNATTDPATADVPVDRTGMTDLDETALTAEELIGTRVVGPDDQQIAEVADLVLTEDGKVDAVLVDFGGFLGIGEKRVAVAMDNLDFATDANGNRYVFLSSITREQLEAAPAYDAATYPTDRDRQRLTLGSM
jgi:sporulation protein YlmC with PRC-barrel domain